jgi:hypothetical protein
MRHGKDVIGVWIGPTQRKAIIEELCISPRRWNRQVEEWISQNIAHRCKRGVVCLWVTPFTEECPGCNVLVEAEVPLRVPKHGNSSDPNKDAPVPNSVPDTGDAMRDGEGDTRGVEGYDGTKALEYLQEDSIRRHR